MKRPPRAYNTQLGFSLVELLVALLIGSTVISGVFSLYVTTKSTQQFSAANSRIQESGRFALTYLKRDIRMISYRGCASVAIPNVAIQAKSMPNDFNAQAQDIVGFEITNNWANDTIYANATGIISKIKLGSDAFGISRMASTNHQLIANMTSDNANIQISTQSGAKFKKSQLVVISDCRSADIFRISNTPNIDGDKMTLTHAADINISNRLSKIYLADANIAHYQSFFYFIGDTSRLNSQGKKIYALYQASNNFDGLTPSFHVEELIEGVENMQLLYGERLANGNTRYLKASNVTNMNAVVVMQLGVLITSYDNVRKSLDSNTYSLPGIDIGVTGVITHAQDYRLRHTFSGTVQVRNRSIMP